MQVDALLCDAATVREGLLHMLGGGVTRLFRPAFPAELGVDLALVVTVSRQELGEPISLGVTIRADATLVASVSGTVQITLPDTEDGSFSTVLGLRGVVLPAAGKYLVEIALAGETQRTLTLYAVVGEYHPQVTGLPNRDRTAEPAT